MNVASHFKRLACVVSFWLVKAEIKDIKGLLKLQRGLGKIRAELLEQHVCGCDLPDLMMACLYAKISSPSPISTFAVIDTPLRRPPPQSICHRRPKLSSPSLVRMQGKAKAKIVVWFVLNKYDSKSSHPFNIDQPIMSIDGHIMVR